MPEQKQICRYKKISDIERQQMQCYAIDAKNPDGTYKFKDTLVITKRRLREILIEKLNEVFDD